MHAPLVRWAVDLEGCSNGSPAQAELASIVDAIEAYEERWSFGQVPGGKRLALRGAILICSTRSGTWSPASSVSLTIEAQRSSRGRPLCARAPMGSTKSH
jgi:hypothetical protein